MNDRFARNYNLDCIAVVDETEHPLFAFKAREYSPRENGAGYVAGGIASGNLKYAIKTADGRVKRLKPYINGILIEDIGYILTSVKVRKADLPYMRERQRGKRTEYVLELE